MFRVPPRSDSRRFPPREAGLIAGIVARDLPYYDAAIAERSVPAINRFARCMAFSTTRCPIATSSRPSSAICGVPPRSSRGRGMRTGAEYREALRDGRKVWVLGEGLVEDVTTHPATSAMVAEYVAWYDRHFDPAWHDTLIAPADARPCRHRPGPMSCRRPPPIWSAWAGPSPRRSSSAPATSPTPRPTAT